MDIKINASNNEYIDNLAFIKALLIKHSIESLNIDYNQKQELRDQILKELKNN